MARTTPRPRDQALEIARRLRERFISPEAQEVARSAFANLMETAAQPEESRTSKMLWGKSEGNTLAEKIRLREGIELPTDEKPFSAEEKQKARAILELFRQQTGLKPEREN
ncbi:hypothetical protein ACFSM5_07580 [Lacibacterium aquatile]|uniref:Uncharacterized protein n=1 Tax=Lacibacterium aquatile TaxID=1168082 RepID=A0ABW5DPQ9_9PROT